MKASAAAGAAHRLEAKEHETKIKPPTSTDFARTSIGDLV